jgi:hypothetical protein
LLSFITYLADPGQARERGLGSRPRMTPIRANIVGPLDVATIVQAVKRAC